MKLISKSILYYLLFSLPLLIVAGLLSYYTIRNEVRDGTDESLWMEKVHAEKLINSLSTPRNIVLSLDSLSKIEIILPTNKTYSFRDTLLFDKEENEYINYRVLESYYKANNTNYLISIAKPTLEEDELMEGLFSSLLLVIGFLVLSFFFVNWVLSKWLWKPFYKTIDSLNNYELSNAQINLNASTINEFNQLNEAFKKMTDKIYSDFVNQKQFTENASHEMQTPLAVIKAKLELLMQSQNLKEGEMNLLQVVDTTVNKLSSLNKALLLLAKIENNQFKDNSKISIKQVIQKVLLNYDDLINAKNILVNAQYKNDISVNMNSGLCDILITNLVQNAIRHNTINGKINIELNSNELTISNTGNPLSIKPRELFERFKKDNNSKESLGLGLSIVKSITDVYKLSLKHLCHENMHSFSIKF